MPLPKKFEDWTPPWGEDHDDIDAAKTAKYIFELLTDKDKLQKRVDTATQERDTARTELATAKSDLEAAIAAGPDKDAVEKAQAAQREAESKVASAELKALRYEVAADKDVPLAQAKRLQGTTKEELEADADEFLQSFGALGANTEGDEEEEEDEGVPTRVPVRLSNPGDPGGNTSTVVDIEKDLDRIPRI